MNMKRLLAWAAIPLVLSACASLPISEGELQNSVEIKNEWQSSDGQALAVENGWLEGLKMTELREFVDEVMINNQNYNEIALRMQAAGFSADAATGRLLPRVGASANASRTGMDNYCTEYI